MNAICPPQDDLLAAMAANGREPAPRKYVWDSGWWLIDECQPSRKREPVAGQPVSDGPAPCSPPTDPALIARILDSARNDGWSVAETAEGIMIDLGGKRRARAQLLSIDGRGHSLCVQVLPEPCNPTIAAAAFMLRLSTYLRLVRASLLDSGRGPRLVWETPLQASDDTEDQIIEALCCLADAVRHGQSEAVLLAQDEAAAACWIGMNFPATNQNIQQQTEHDHGNQ